MSIFWILVGVGVLIFLAEAGYALITWSERTNPFVGSIFDEDLDDNYIASLEGKNEKKTKKRSKKTP